MKKLAMSLIFPAYLIIIIPSVFALNAMTVLSMKNATAQRGVKIYFDLDISDCRWTIFYQDEDGVSGNLDDEAFITIAGTFERKTYREIRDHTDRNSYLQREYGSFMRREANSIGAAYDDWKSSDPDLNTALLEDWKAEYPEAVSAAITASGHDIVYTPLIIDVVPKLETLSYLMSLTKPEAGPVSGVAARLPTLEIHTIKDIKTIGVESLGSVNDGKAYIEISTSDNVMTILGGIIEICAN